MQAKLADVTIKKDNIVQLQNGKAGRVPGMTIEPQVPQELLQKAKAYTDTAVISICRFSGEGWDRKSIVETENKNIWASEEEMARRSAEIFEDGDFYLTHAEQEMVNTVKQNFARVIVVMNVGGSSFQCKSGSC